MGADLVGYLVKGPCKIDVEKLFTPVNLERVEKTREYVHSLNQWLRGAREQEAPIAPDPTLDNLRTWVTAYEEELDELEGDAADWLRETAETWNNLDFRDVASRLDPDDPNQVIVFAGDMSWGNEPEGCGYQFLRQLEHSGFWSILGLK